MTGPRGNKPNSSLLPPTLEPRSNHIRNIPLDIVLSLITCGLFNLRVQYKQMAAVNEMLQQPKYSFAKWLLLTLITCGLYHIYHEYRFMSDIVTLTNRTHSHEALACMFLAILGLSIVADALQQEQINRHFGG